MFLFNLTENEYKMLNILSNKLVFKFKTLLDSQYGELNLLFFEFSREEVEDFIKKMNKKGYFITNDKYKKNMTDVNNFVSMVIDWSSIISNDLIGNNSNIMNMYKNYPTTFEITYKKASYLMNLEHFKYKEVANSIHTLDSLFLLYFTNLNKFKMQFKEEEPISIVDIYTNIQANLAIVSLDSRELYNIDTYEKVLNESNLKIEWSIKTALIEKANKALEKNKSYIDKLKILARK